MSAENTGSINIGPDLTVAYTSYASALNQATVSLETVTEEYVNRAHIMRDSLHLIDPSDLAELGGVVLETYLCSKALAEQREAARLRLAELVAPLVGCTLLATNVLRDAHSPIRKLRRNYMLGEWRDRGGIHTAVGTVPRLALASANEGILSLSAPSFLRRATRYDIHITDPERPVAIHVVYEPPNGMSQS